MSDPTRWEALAREWAERPMSMVPFRVYSSHNVLLDSFRGFLAEFAAAVEAQARAEVRPEQIIEIDEEGHVSPPIIGPIREE